MPHEFWAGGRIGGHQLFLPVTTGGLDYVTFPCDWKIGTLLLKVLQELVHSKISKQCNKQEFFCKKTKSDCWKVGGTQNGVSG